MKIKKKTEKIFWIVLSITFFILFLLAGYLRVSYYGKINAGEMIFVFRFAVTFAFLIYTFIFLNNKLKTKYYTSKASSSRLIAGGYTFLTLIFPKGCFKKQDFWKGYFVYLISRVSLIISIYLLISFIRRI